MTHEHAKKDLPMIIKNKTETVGSRRDSISPLSGSDRPFVIIAIIIDSLTLTEHFYLLRYLYNWVCQGTGTSELPVSPLIVGKFNQRSSLVGGLHKRQELRLAFAVETGVLGLQVIWLAVLRS